MTVVQDAATNAAHSIQRLLRGEGPNGITPEDCGEWAEIVTELNQTYARGGTADVRKKFDSLSRAYPDLAVLIARGTPAKRTIPATTQGFVELPDHIRFADDVAANGCKWLDEYVAFSRKWSPQSYDGFHSACGLWLLSTVAARRVMLHFGDKRYTNLYIAFVARSSLYAKSTATKIAQHVIKDAGLNHLLSPNDSTPQAFIRSRTIQLPEQYGNLSEDERTKVRKRLSFAAQRGWFYEEFGTKISAMMRNDGVMADFRGLLRSIDDTPEAYSYETISRGTEEVERPYLSLLANMTPADLKPFARKGSALWSDGFFARFAFVAPAANTPRGRGRFPQEERTIPRAILEPIKEVHTRLGVPAVNVEEITNDEGKPTGRYRASVGEVSPLECRLGEGVYDAFYNYLEALKDILEQTHNSDLDGNYTRLAEKALRIAMLFAALDNDGLIELRHWAKAQYITEEWRRNLHNLIEQIEENTETSDGKANEDKILRILAKSEQSMTIREMAQKAWGLSADEVRAIVEGLERTGYVECQSGGKAKRYVAMEQV